MTKYLGLVLACSFVGSSLSQASSTAHRVPLIQEGYLVSEPNSLPVVREQSELIVDHIKANSFEVYGPKGLGAWLNKQQIPVSSNLLAPKFQPRLKSQIDYPTPEQIGETLLALMQQYPDLIEVKSIGKSTQNRDLWVAKLTKNVQQPNSRPEFKYIANMHGDEIVGRELMIRLIRDLLQNYNVTPEITDLLDTTQIYILPSMNPDGAAAQTRANGAGVDLNRDFPEATENEPNTPTGRALETQAVMAWEGQHHFQLSANFHGGAQVVNYPWDAKPDLFPLNDLVVSIAKDYAASAAYIAQAGEFTQGITNGFAWYQVLGGMQDWSITQYNDLQLTIELSDEKWPEASSIDTYYENNRKALIGLIQRIHKLPQISINLSNSN
jgi:hypothetical protein